MLEDSINTFEWAACNGTDYKLHLTIQGSQSIPSTQPNEIPGLHFCCRRPFRMVCAQQLALSLSQGFHFLLHKIGTGLNCILSRHRSTCSVCCLISLSYDEIRAYMFHLQAELALYDSANAVPSFS